MGQLVDKIDLFGESNGAKERMTNWNDPEIVQQYFDAQREFYNKHIDDSRVRLFTLIGDVQGKRVLDVGCGYGWDIRRLVRGADKRLKSAGVMFSGGAEVIGIDSSQAMLDVGIKKFPDLEGRLFCIDFRDLSRFSEKSFDVIFSRYALHYVDGSLDPVYEQFHRILRADGTLLYLAAHPLLGMFATDNNYFTRGISEFTIYDGKFRLTEPKHTFNDYLTIYFLKNFSLEVFEEQKEKVNENNFQAKISDYFIIKARKR